MLRQTVRPEAIQKGWRFHLNLHLYSDELIVLQESIPVGCIPTAEAACLRIPYPSGYPTPNDMASGIPYPLPL